jgi:uncharacterized protein involved in propanediol utilization
MPADKEKVKELSVRIPHELWNDILDLFEKRHLSGISHNQKVITLLYEAMDKYQIDEKERQEKAQ